MADTDQELRDFLADVELTGIGCFETYGVRGGLHHGHRAIVGPGQIDELDFEEEQEVVLYWPKGGGRLLVRLRQTLIGEMGELRAGVQAEYDVGKVTRDHVSLEIQAEFVNRVAVMALVPYLREALSDLSMRTFGTPVLIPVIRADELNFTRKRPEAENTTEA